MVLLPMTAEVEDGHDLGCRRSSSLAHSPTLKTHVSLCSCLPRASRRSSRIRDSSESSPCGWGDIYTTVTRMSDRLITGCNTTAIGSSNPITILQTRSA
jgi:hypothetical protein